MKHTNSFRRSRDRTGCVAMASSGPRHAFRPGGPARMHRPDVSEVRVTGSPRGRCDDPYGSPDHLVARAPTSSVRPTGGPELRSRGGDRGCAHHSAGRDAIGLSGELHERGATVRSHCDATSPVKDPSEQGGHPSAGTTDRTARSTGNPGGERAPRRSNLHASVCASPAPCSAMPRVLGSSRSSFHVEQDK